MSLAEKQALALRDLAVMVAKAKGVIISTNQPGHLYTYHDARIRIEYCSGNMQNGRPASLELFKLGDMASRDPKVLSVIWNDGGDGAGSVVVLHRTGSWEDSLRRLAKACL
jgi:hypothetical protein